MGAQENGLTLEGLAHKLDAMQYENTERIEALERENERMRSENELCVWGSLVRRPVLGAV